MIEAALLSVSPGLVTPPVSARQLNMLTENTGQSLSPSQQPPNWSIAARAPTVSSYTRSDRRG